MKFIEFEAIIESILFASGESVSVKNLSEAIGQDIKTTKALVNNLSDKYSENKRGIKIIQVGESYQMCTNPEYFSYIRKLYSVPQKKTLSSTLLETLAIIAYKQPITKMQIEQIRGVNSDHCVNKLIEYNLVAEKGRMDAPGKPILLGTTDEFLKYFGFKDIKYLPDINNSLEEVKEETEIKKL